MIYIYRYLCNLETEERIQALQKQLRDKDYKIQKYEQIIKANNKELDLDQGNG